MEQNQRIEQFRQMAEADPDNELGHFSFGKALLEAERFADAVAPLARAIELRPAMSKAYQLLGQAYDGSGNREQAVEMLTKGALVADEQGDVMPRETMARILGEWGAEVPVFKSAEASGSGGSAEGSASAEGFRCSRCGRPDGQLAKPPFKGELGTKVFDHVCNGCWQEWIPMGTKVINELSLILSTPEGAQSYDQYMLEFLQLEEC